MSFEGAEDVGEFLEVEGFSEQQDIFFRQQVGKLGLAKLWLAKQRNLAGRPRLSAGLDMMRTPEHHACL